MNLFLESHRQTEDRTDRQLSDSIGRTVLQTVTQKSLPLKKAKKGFPKVQWLQLTDEVGKSMSH